MTQTEILNVLLNNGIIHRIGDQWLLTDLYETLMEEPDTSILDFDEVEVKEVTRYPDEIRLVKPSKRVDALLDYCEVPLMHTTNSGKKYPVRSSDKATRNAIEKILSDTDIEAEILLASIKDYYTNTDYPKAFKNYVKDGDIYTMYEFAKKGDTLGGDALSKDPGIWI